MFILFDVTCVAFLLSLILTPLIRNLSNRLGFVDLPDGNRKSHPISIPRVGGLAVALAYGLSLIFVYFAPYRNVTIDLPRGLSGALSLAPAVGVILLTGLIDDIRGLKPLQKLAAEVLAALLAYSAGFRIDSVLWLPIGEWVSLPITVLWLIGCTNALNLIDGMDGLAAGVGVFATLTSFVAALIHGSLELAFVTAPLVGALMGFLRYNFNPASIFLGDSGSLFIGFLLGCFGTLWGQKSATTVGMTAPLIALALPLLDTTLAIVRRLLRGQPIFAGDRGHIHHRLLDQGLTPRKAALVLYSFCGLAAVMSLLQDVANNQYRGLIVILFAASAWMGVQHLGYAEFGITSKFVLRGSFRRMVDSQMSMQQFERTLHKTQTPEEAWGVIRAGMEKFGIDGVRLRIGDHDFDSVPALDGDKCWQVRVPLTDGQFLNLYYAPESDVQPVVLAYLPKVLAHFLATRFTGASINAEPAAVVPQNNLSIPSESLENKIA